VPFLLFIALKLPLAIETICILLIDLGTDLAPAVALAYEEPEDAIMRKPPRRRTDHLVGPSMMLVAYGTIGLFECAAAYFSFFYVFHEKGWHPGMLTGTGTDWTIKPSEDGFNPTFWRNQCETNDVYNYGVNATEHCAGLAGEEAFYSYRMDALRAAQAAFLISVVWAQIANILVRKTQSASIFTWKRMTENKIMTGSILFEIALIAMLVYTPDVNEVFLLKNPGCEGGALNCSPTAKAAFAAIWSIPFIIGWDEIRKFLVRLHPNGWLDRYTTL
jgi:sodium/potassium-transporting ATPase subunit alpha